MADTIHLSDEVNIQEKIYNSSPKDPITAKIITPVIKCNKGELVIMEYIEGDTFWNIFDKSLKDFKEDESPIKFSKILNFMNEAFKLVDKLHAMNIIHGDLHGNNIMHKVVNK